MTTCAKAHHLSQFFMGEGSADNGIAGREAESRLAFPNGVFEMELQGIQRRLECVVTDSVRARLSKYTNPLPDDRGCLLWIGSQRNGYGAIKINSKVFNAHVVSFLANGGEIPQGYVIGHKCDVKLCVNPLHLECITVAKNNQDAQARRVRNAPRGEEIARVLTESLVRTIRQMYKPKEFGYRKISRALGINENTIKHVLNGRIWGHVK